MFANLSKLEREKKKFKEWLLNRCDRCDNKDYEICMLPIRQFIDLKLYRKFRYRIIGNTVIYGVPISFNLKSIPWGT